MSARAHRIHGTGELLETIAWALVGVACGPLAIWIAWAVCKAALAAMEGA